MANATDVMYDLPWCQALDLRIVEEQFDGGVVVSSEARKKVLQPLPDNGVLFSRGVDPASSSGLRQAVLFSKCHL